MDSRQELEQAMADTLKLMKDNVDRSFEYLEQHPEDKEEMARLWSGVVREFMSYGMKKSEGNSGHNLFKRVSRLVMFGR